MEPQIKLSQHLRKTRKEKGSCCQGTQDWFRHTLTQQYWLLHYTSHKEKEEIQTENILWKRNQNNSPINKTSAYTGEKKLEPLPYNNYSNIHMPPASILYNLKKTPPPFPRGKWKYFESLLIKRYRNTTSESNRKIFSSCIKEATWATVIMKIAFFIVRFQAAKSVALQCGCYATAANAPETLSAVLIRGAASQSWGRHG